MLTRDEILKALAKLTDEDVLYPKSSPETRSCIFCGEDMSYQWRGEMRYPLYRHKPECVMIEARRADGLE